MLSSCHCVTTSSYSLNWPSLLYRHRWMPWPQLLWSRSHMLELSWKFFMFLSRRIHGRSAHWVLGWVFQYNLFNIQTTSTTISHDTKTSFLSVGYHLLISDIETWVSVWPWIVSLHDSSSSFHCQPNLRSLLVVLVLESELREDLIVNHHHHHHHDKDFSCRFDFSFSHPSVVVVKIEKEWDESAKSLQVNEKTFLSQTHSITRQKIHAKNKSKHTKESLNHREKQDTHKQKTQHLHIIFHLSTPLTPSSSVCLLFHHDFEGQGTWHGNRII